MNERKVLNSWKEIANHIGRGVRTVQRYEAELGLPVRRVKGEAHTAVCALSDEIEQWVISKPMRSALGGESDKNGSSHQHTNGAAHANSATDREILRSVIITPELWRRPSPLRDREPFERALRCLKIARNGSQQDLLDTLVRAALDLCGADTSGFSVLHRNAEGQEFFRWDAMAGELAHAVGGTTPREWSPCGVTLDRQSAQLFAYPARCFSYFNEAQPAIVEGLVLPVFTEQGPFGTLWIVSHDKSRRFDAEDVRIMNSLAHFCAAAVQEKRAYASLAAAAGSKSLGTEVA